MKQFIILFFIALFLLKFSGAQAEEIIPGGIVSRGYKISNGEKLFLSGEGLNEACAPREGNIMFCVPEEGELLCAYLSGHVNFTFKPEDKIITYPLKSMGYSDAKDRFPDKEYTVKKCP